MHAGTILLDGFQYDVVERTLPKLDPATGGPSGETIDVRVLVIVDQNLRVEIQLLTEQMKELGQRLSGSRIVQSAILPPGVGNGRAPG